MRHRFLLRNAQNQARIGAIEQFLDIGFKTRLFVTLGCLLAGCLGIGADSHPVPTISARLGPCSAEFTVSDAAHRPIYNADIDVMIHYGLMDRLRTELEIQTDSRGKARLEGLPVKTKKPLQFRIQHGAETKSITRTRQDGCHAKFEVAF